MNKACVLWLAATLVELTAQANGSFTDANWINLSTGVSGVSGTVYAAALDSSSNLYVGGSLTVAGKVAARNIAKWNGTNWSALGSGMNASVNALAVSGNILYAAGSFTNAGGIAANYVAQWDGTNWSPLASGVSSSVLALAVSGGNVYAGGTFSTASGNTVNCVAEWNGNGWSALSSGVGGLFPTVSSMAVSGAFYMWAVLLRQPEATGLSTSRNGTAPIGRRWEAAWTMT